MYSICVTILYVVIITDGRWLASSTDQGPVPRSQMNINPGLKLTMIDIVCSNLSLLSYWLMFS